MNEHDVKLLDFITDAVGWTNEDLPDFLTFKDINTWFPAKGLTYEYNEKLKQLSICYYHDQRLYDYIYNFTLDKMPNFDVSSLNNLYKMYTLTSKSPEVFKKITLLRWYPFCF